MMKSRRVALARLKDERGVHLINRHEVDHSCRFRTIAAAVFRTSQRVQMFPRTSLLPAGRIRRLATAQYSSCAPPFLQCAYMQIELLEVRHHGLSHVLYAALDLLCRALGGLSPSVHVMELFQSLLDVKECLVNH
jgi:hypothetical protein